MLANSPVIERTNREASWLLSTDDRCGPWLLAVLALALVAWKLAVGATSSSATRSAPVKTTGSGPRYVEPDAQDSSAPIVPGPEASGRFADSHRLADQIVSPDPIGCP